MIRTTPLLAVCLAAFALPAVAQSQAYPFENVAHGHTAGGLSMAKQDLIQSDQQLQASGLAHLIPTGTTIDFSEEVLLAVRMGSRPTGGYGIQIRSISVRPSSGSVPGGPAVSLTTQLRVKAVTQSPGPMDLVTKGFTSPYHVVKVKRPLFGGLVASFEIADAAVEFNTFSRNVGSPFHNVVRSIEISRDGAVTVLESGPGPNADVIQVNTRVEERFIGQLRTVLGRVDFTTLPTDISGPIPALDGPYLTYLLSKGPLSQRVAGDRMSIAPEMRTRLLPLDELLTMIRDEAVNSPQFEDFKGTVVLHGDDVVLSGPQKAYTLTGELAATVGMFEGETVKISGAISTSADSMEIDRILYPEHQPRLTATLQTSGDLLMGSYTAELKGPAAAALATVDSKRLVELDAWLFSNLNTGNFTKVYAVSAEAKVTARYSFLTLSGLPQGWARRGETLRVLGLSKTGKWARVKKGDLEAYTRLKNLRIGGPTVLGLSDAVGGNK